MSCASLGELCNRSSPKSANDHHELRHLLPSISPGTVLCIYFFIPHFNETQPDFKLLLTCTSLRRCRDKAQLLFVRLVLSKANDLLIIHFHFLYFVFFCNLSVYELISGFQTLRETYFTSFRSFGTDYDNLTNVCSQQLYNRSIFTWFDI